MVFCVAPRPLFSFLVEVVHVLYRAYRAGVVSGEVRGVPIIIYHNQGIHPQCVGSAVLFSHELIMKPKLVGAYYEIPK